jgi:hypothetical protein
MEFAAQAPRLHHKQALGGAGAMTAGCKCRYTNNNRR